MTETPTSLLWRIFLVVAAVIIAWQIVTINMADHYVLLAREGDGPAVETALFWDSDHPTALTMKARQYIAAEQDELAEPLLVESIQGNPADARPLLLLAELHRRRGDEILANNMAETADRLMPVHDKVQRSLAGYWAEHGRLDLAVDHLARALSGNPNFRADGYPALLRVAEDASLRQFLAPIAAEPPSWWGGFFHYAIKNALDTDGLRALITMREASVSDPISENERNAYINRLRKDGLVSEAYMHWVSGLSAESLKSLGYLYNGSFEHEPSNSGFDWYARPPKGSGIRINTSTTYGIDGSKALNIHFGGKRVRFNHLYQNVYLAPGNYKLYGRVRPDNLKARRGLQWGVYCTVGGKAKLGQSDLMIGTGDWREFEFDIVVPQECVGQMLRLQSVGSREVDHELRGNIWFDDLHIELQREKELNP